MSATSRMACADAERQLQGYVDRVLSAAEILTIEAHLAACERCARCYRLEQVMREKLRSACAEPCPEALKVRLRNLCEECDCD